MPNCIECGKSTACFYRLSPQCAMPANSIESPTTNQIQPTIRPPTGEELRGASCCLVRAVSPQGSAEGAAGRPDSFLGRRPHGKEPRALGHATCLEVFQAALSVSLADDLDPGLGDRGDADRPSAAGRHQIHHRLWPEPQAAARAVGWRWFPSLAEPRNLLLATVIAVAVRRLAA